MSQLASYFLYTNDSNLDWTKKFETELNHFFGKGKWECISEETKKSKMYSKCIRRSSNYSETLRAGEFKNWDILYHEDGKEEIWTITNHTLKINHDKYLWLFDSRRYSDKQAFVLELMDIGREIASEEVFEEIIKSELSDKEADCIDVSISYHGGNPKPEFYDELFKQTWFNANEISAENFLNCNLHDFYLDIRAYDYSVEKLTEQEQQHIFNSLEAIENKLIKKYGENISFEIYLNKENKVKYGNWGK